MSEPHLCRVCNTENPSFFNIGLKPVPICDGCANSITVQQVHALTSNDMVQMTLKVEAEKNTETVKVQLVLLNQMLIAEGYPQCEDCGICTQHIDVNKNPCCMTCEAKRNECR